MGNEEEKLKKFRRQIEESKAEVLRLEGEEKSLLDRLKKEHNITSLQQAEEKLAEYKESINNMTKSLAASVAKLEKDYVIE
jgi:hypothetical protein